MANRECGFGHTHHTWFIRKASLVVLKSLIPSPPQTLGLVIVSHLMRCTCRCVGVSPHKKSSIIFNRNFQNLNPPYSIVTIKLLRKKKSYTLYFLINYLMHLSSHTCCHFCFSHDMYLNFGDVLCYMITNCLIYYYSRHVCFYEFGTWECCFM